MEAGLTLDNIEKSSSETARRDQCDLNLERAEADLQKAAVDIRSAELELAQAEAEIEEARRARHEVEVIVDRMPKRIEAGRYVVAVLKKEVGVAPDRELDLLKDGVLEPLDDNAEITIHGCEVFVSHVRCGGSAW